MTRLAPPKNIREVKKACCANCLYLVTEKDWLICQRDPDGAPFAEFGEGEMGIHMTVCDGRKKKGKREK